MSTIVNPTPVAAGTFGGMWVTMLQVDLKNRVRGFLYADLLPFDGANLLANGGKRVYVPNLEEARKTDVQLGAVIDNMIAESKRISGKDLEVLIMQVSAPDPRKGVKAQVFFSDTTSYTVDDCFGLAGTDPQFASMFLGALAEVARQAGLTFTP